MSCLFTQHLCRFPPEPWLNVALLMRDIHHRLMVPPGILHFTHIAACAPSDSGTHTHFYTPVGFLAVGLCTIHNCLTTEKINWQFVCCHIGLSQWPITSESHSCDSEIAMCIPHCVSLSGLLEIEITHYGYLFTSEIPHECLHMTFRLFSKQLL